MPGPSRLLPASLALGCALASGPVRASPDAGPLGPLRPVPLPQALTESWRWVAFGPESGLPSPRVTAIVETEAGTPWVQCSAGLAWYDGHAWHGVGPDQGLPDGLTQYLAPAGGDRVMALVGGILHEGDRHGFRRARGPPGLRSVARIADGTRVGATETGLFAWRDGQPRAVPTPFQGWGPLGSGPFLSAASGRALVRRNGLYAWDGVDLHDVLRRPGVPLGVVAAAEAPGGAGVASVIEPTSARGLWTWGPGRRARREAALGPVGVEAVAVRGDGLVLAVEATGRALVRVAGHEAWTSVEAAAPLGGTNALCFRPDGNLWVGGDDGLLLLHASSTRWSAWRHAASEDPRNSIHALAVTAAGDLWAATRDGVEVFAGDGSRRHVREIDGQPLGEVTGLASDGTGGAWVSSGSAFTGAWHWDGDSWTRHGAAEGLVDEPIHAIHRDRFGRIWFLGIAALRGGPEPGAMILEDGTTRRLVPPGDPDSARVYDVAVDSRGVAWLATAGGLLRFDGESWRRWGAAEGLVVERVFAVAVDADDRPWLANQWSGLGTIDPDGSLRFVSSRDGLAHHGIWDIASSPDGSLWVATSSGLSLLDRGAWHSLGVEHGLPSPRLWPILLLEDRLLIGTVGHGLAVLHLSAEQARPPAVAIDPILVSEHRSALVRWTARAFDGAEPPDTLLTRHRVGRGAWSPWSRRREVEVAGLASGDHVVEVQGRGMFAAKSGEHAVRRFEVPPRAWQQPLFWLPALGLGLLAGVTGAVSWRRRRAHATELARREHRQAAILDGAGDAIFAMDPRGRLTEVNRAGEVLAGRSREALLLRDPRELLTPRSARAAARLVRRQVADGRPVTFEVQLPGADGEPRLVEVSTRPCRDDGRPTEIHGVARDVTERRRLEERMRQAQKLESLGVLAGGIAHDFNNLLQVVRGSAGLMQEGGDLTPVQRRNVERIETATRRATDLTRLMLAYSGRGRFVVGPVDLSALAQEMTDLMEASIPKTIDLRRELSPGLPPVEGDRAQLQQVVMNLLTNAAEAVGPAGGTVTVRTGMDDVDARCLRAAHFDSGTEPGPRTWVEVTDTGPGLTEDARSRAFDPFFTTKGPGRGLGLAAVIGIVRGHGGTLEVQGEPGVGTRFRVLFPSSAAPPVTVDSGADVPPAERVRLTGRRVLVVDDEAGVRAVTESILTGAGCEVSTARDGVEAIERVRADAAGYDAVVLDLLMPRLGGADTLKGLRALRPDLPVVVTSGYSRDETAALGVPRGAAAFLAKPYRPDQLVSALVVLLAPGGAAAGRDAALATRAPGPTGVR